MNCGHLTGTRFGVVESDQRPLPGAEQAGAAPGRDQAAVPVGADLHLADGGRTNGLPRDPELGVHLVPVGLVLALAARAGDPPVDRAHGGDPVALGELGRLADEDAVGVGEDQRLVVELALGPGRDRDLVEGRGRRRSGRPAARRRAVTPSASSRSTVAGSGRAPAAARTRTRAPRRRSRPRRAGSRPAGSPRSRAARARRRAGMRVWIGRARAVRVEIARREVAVRGGDQPALRRESFRYARVNLCGWSWKALRPSGATRAAQTRPGRPRFWRDALRRRMLALADLIAAARGEPGDHLLVGRRLLGPGPASGLGRCWRS